MTEEIYVGDIEDGRGSRKILKFTVSVRYVANDEQEEIIKERVKLVIEDLGIILEARLGDGVGEGLIEYEVEENEV